MYSWIFRHLPGPLSARILLSLVLLAALVVLLFTKVFPALDAQLDVNEVTVE